MSSQNSVQTFGWDTAYSASFTVLNQAIISQKKYPTSFDFTTSATVVLKGEWSSWQLSTGGAGKNVSMVCDITSGTISALNQSADLSGTVLSILINLHQVAAQDPLNDPTAKGGKSLALVVNPTSSGAAPAVSVVSVQTKVTGILNAVLQSSFTEYFNANITSFEQVFSVMNINGEADNGDYQWLKPTAFDYAVASPEEPTLDNSAFGLIAMVLNHPILPTQQPAVDVRALVGLPSGANSAFVISQTMVAQNLLLKGAVQTLLGSTEKDFDFTSDGLSLTNNKDLTWGNFKTSNGIITPTIPKGNFILRADNTYVLVEVTNAQYSPSAGITVNMNLTQKFGFKTVQRESDGQYVFVPDDTGFGKPNFSANVAVAEWLKIIEIIAGVVGAIAGVLCVASGIAEAFAAGAEVATDEAANAGSIVIDEAVAEAAAEADPAALESENAAGAADADAAASGTEQTTSGILTSSKFKLYTGIAAALSGVVAGGIAVAKAANELEYDDIPAFDSFAANCLGASKWPAMKDYKLLSASFKDSLVIATEVSTE